MIVFYGEGRLGNQIFQYQAMATWAAPGTMILAFGLEELANVLALRGPKVTVLTRRWLVKRAAKYLLVPLLLRPMSRNFRLFNYVDGRKEESTPSTTDAHPYSLKKGLVQSVTFIDGGTFLDASFFKNIFPVPTLEVRQDLKLTAAQFLSAARTGKDQQIFVHVRRGDFIGHSAFGVQDIVLPEPYYRNALSQASARLGPTQFIFVTDDPSWVEVAFADIRNKIIVSRSAALDFAIMTECRGGIISNSTFSLAAALLVRDPHLIIGPLHWVGFRVGRWLPPRIQFFHDRMIYLPARSVA